MSLLNLGIGAVERGLVPDFVTRRAMRRLCGERLKEVDLLTTAQFQQTLESGPIALVPEKANEQHYELPPDFFAACLGQRRKYSCCLFPTPQTTLDEAEDAALTETCAHAEIEDGQEILELGCGWGSLSLWLAEKYPACRITAVSNSAPQREFITRRAQAQGFTNLRVITADMNAFAPQASAPFGARFDRVVSVEMFEHMRNYDLLLERIASWLLPGGKLFVHIFCHRQFCYPFEEQGEANWMGRYFFSGGLMPNETLLHRFERVMSVARRWSWNGTHYARTSAAWLKNLDERRDDVLPILVEAYGPAEARLWFNRWRMFYLAVEELFGYAQGNEWFVSHYLLVPSRGH
ncbi:MAG: class I SAM-dependent methyltransferase [Planctomycetes bacterium]|nr:class I SAM-dependent methyltransferase [Planctomycetota bacterium]